MQLKLLLFIILFSLSIATVSAINTSGGNYTVDLFTESLAGGELNDSNYTGTYTFTTKPAVVGIGGDFEATTGLFPQEAENITNATPPVDTPSYDGGGGGGSGGGGSVPSPVITKNPIKVRLSEQARKTFSIGNRQHQVTIKNIVGKIVTFLFQSEPIEVDIAEGETKTVDLDSDGNDDISVHVISVTQTGVDFEMASLVEVLNEEVNLTEDSVAIPVALNESVPPITNPGATETPKIEETLVEEQTNDNSLRMMVWLGIIVLVLITGFIAWQIEKKPIEKTLDEKLVLLKEYIKKHTESGHHPKEVHKVLKEHGWPDEHLKQAFADLGIDVEGEHEHLPQGEAEHPHTPVKRYLHEHLDKGHDLLALRKVLIEAGWKQEIVDHIIDEVGKERDE